MNEQLIIVNKWINEEVMINMWIIVITYWWLLRCVFRSENYYWCVKWMIVYRKMWDCNHCCVVFVAWLIVVKYGVVIIVVFLLLHYRMPCIICCSCSERGESKVHMWGLVICPKLREGVRGSDVGTWFIWRTIFE